jgi:hypothetical protein
VQAIAFDFKSRPPRPRKGDRLFRCDLPGEPDNARLRCDPDAYTIGYRRAAEHLVQYVLAHQRESGSLAYPIVFLYRHHIELALKRIIYCTPGVLRRDLTKSEQDHLRDHDLCQLWHDLEPIFASICEAVNWEKPKAADLEGIREYVRQLSAVDPLSTSFRYWKSKTGNPSLPASLHSFNIRHFSEMMGRLADFIEALDTATTAASEMLDDLDNAH